MLFSGLLSKLQWDPPSFPGGKASTWSKPSPQLALIGRPCESLSKDQGFNKQVV